jgi:hypothetical protein
MKTPKKTKSVYGEINAPSLKGWDKMAKPVKHPGFKAVQASIAAKEGIPLKNAGAILAASSRNASAAAKKANPRLKRVKGK